MRLGKRHCHSLAFRTRPTIFLEYRLREIPLGHAALSLSAHGRQRHPKWGLPLESAPSPVQRSPPGLLNVSFAFSYSPINCGNPIYDADDPLWSSTNTSTTAVTATHLTFPSESLPTFTAPVDRKPDLMSDEDYEAFLEKASEDRDKASAGVSARQSGAQPAEFTTESVDCEVPRAIKDVAEQEVYVSESDEQFAPVALTYSGSDSSIGVESFRSLTGHERVDALSLDEFDKKGKYKRVVEAVNSAGNGVVEVFRVKLHGARYEYWILCVDSKGGKVVGVRAGAVES